MSSLTACSGSADASDDGHDSIFARVLEAKFIWEIEVTGVVGMPPTGQFNLRVTSTRSSFKVIHGDRGTEVDSTEPRKDVGILGWYDRLDYERQWHESYIAKGIEKLVTEGDRLARIEDGGNAIADIAAERLSEYEQDHRIELGMLPSSRPRITVRYTPTRIEFTPGSISIQYGNKWSGLDVLV